MPIHSEKNLYPGINPHLNSALQQHGGDWKSFHAFHLVHIAGVLNRIMPLNYSAKAEESLQISVYDAVFLYPEGTVSTITADVLISSSGETSEAISPMSRSSTPALTLPMPQVIDPEDELTAIVIYDKTKPITRIELISPANKPQGSHYSTYIRKRAETLYAGLRMVEIDYLHERHPMIEKVPSYAAGQPDAVPYHVLVSDPRPTFDKGQVKVHRFGVLDAMPLVDIPLEGEDAVQLDLGAVYNQTYSERPFWQSVDYEQVPVNFEAYSEADRERIRRRMDEIGASQPFDT